MSVREILVRARPRAGVLLIATCAVSLAACGDSGGDAPPGSPRNPQVNKQDAASEERSAKSESASKPSSPGFKAVLEQQRTARGTGTALGTGKGTATATGSADEQTNPCTLVTKAQAQTILGVRLLDPFLAPQGPTCVYRNRSGSSFATVAVESLSFDEVRPEIKRTERVTVSGRVAYCGVRGRPMLYLPLSSRTVLSVAAPCDTARRFARRAVPRLTG